MDYKQYLIDQKLVQLGAVAKLMWPKNNNAKVYLSMKLNGSRPWTAEDNKAAGDALRKIGLILTELE